jgi:hypothetical protein
MLPIIIVLIVAIAALVAFSLRKKSSHDEVKASDPINPTADPAVSTSEVVEPIAAPEKKVVKKASTVKKAVKKAAPKKTVKK